MGDVIHLVEPEDLDDTAKFWRSLMNLVELSPLSMAEKLGTMAYVQHELMDRMMNKAKDD